MADYDAGRAYLAVLPSTRGFAQRLKSELAGVKQDYTVNVGVDVDQRGLAGLQAALRALPVVVLDADSTPADREIAALRARIQELSGRTIGVDISGEQARRQVADIKGDLDRLGASSPDVAVRVDAGAASAALDRVQRDISQVDGRRVTANVNVDVNRALQSLAALTLALNGVDGRSFNASVLVDTGRAVAGVAMLVTKLFAIGGAVGAISSVAAAIAALGPVAAVAGGGIAAMVLAFGGIGKALTALGAQQDAAGKTAAASAQQQAQSARQVESAQLQVTRTAQASSQARSDAAQSVSRAEQQSAQQIAQAQKSAAASIATADKQAEAAHRTLGQATRDLEREQRTLTTAWTAGTRALQDLQDQVDGNALDQRQAAYDLKDAKTALDEARKTGDVDKIGRAQLAYDRQLETIDQLNKQTQRLGNDNKAAQAKGVAGTEQYQSALDRVAQAAQRQQDAIRGVRDADAAASAARIEGAASVAAAEQAGRQRVADAVEQGRRQVASADQAASDAQRALQAALSQTATTADSAGDAVRTAFANLSPAAAAFAMYLWSLKPALDQLRATAAAALFPPLQAGLEVLMGQFSVFNTVIGQFAAGVGAALGYVLTQLASPFWTSFFSALGAVAGPLLMQLAQAFMAVAGVVAQLILALLPFAPMAIDMITLVAMLLEAWTPFIAMFVGQLLPVFGMLLQALMPLGPVLGALAPILAVLGQAFSMVLGAVLQALAPILVALTPLIQQLAMAFANQLVAAVQAATPFLVGLATFMSQHPGLVMGVLSAIGALLTGWGLLKAAVGALLSPLMLIRLGMMLFGTSVSGLLGPLVAGASAVGGFITSLASKFSFLQLGGVLIRGIGMAISAVMRAILGALGPVGMLITILGFLFTTNEQFRGAVLGLLGVFGQLVGQILASLAPAFDIVGQIMSIFGGVVGGIASGLATALIPVVQALADLLSWLSPVIVPLVDAFLAVRGAMMLWAAAQWALNIAMAANPIGLIVLAVAALVGAAVWAYQNLSWFRDAVDAVGAAFVWVWQSVLQPVVDFFWSLLGPAIKWIGDNWSWLSTVLGIMIGPIGWIILAFTNFRDQTMAVLTAVGGAFVWFWQSIVVPAWNAITAAVSWAWTTIIWPVLQAIGTALAVLGAVIFTVLVAPFIIAWNIISAIVSWAWTNVIWPTLQFLWQGIENLAAVMVWFWQSVVVPVWNAIAGAIAFVWNTIIRIVWDAMMFYVNNVIVPVMQFLYNNVILPIWNAIGAAISFVWNSIILPIWTALVWTINNVLIPATQFFYNNVIKPVWDAIGAAIMWVWTNVINPAFQAVWGGLQWLGDRFRDGVGFIQRVWDTIRGILARPINFMINTVWNNGILTAWNKVAGLVGIPAIAPLAPIAEMATGGPVRGPGSGTSDDVPIWASNGEFMVREKIATRAAPFLAALNAGDGEALQAAGATRAGRSSMFHGTSGIGMDVRGYRNGGPIFASGRGVWGSAGRYAMGGPIEERINAAKSWLSGPARGIPYVWGGGSMSGMDCSGMQAAVTHILSGRAPTSGRIGTTASMPWGGFQGGINGQYAVGNKPSDHMAGTLAGQNVEQHGPSGTPFAFPSRWGADNGYFPQKYHLGEAGGSFVSGGAGGGGSWFNPLPGIVRAAFSLTDIPLKLFKGLVGDPPPEYRRIPVGLAYKVRDTLRDFVVQKAELAGPSDGMDTSGIVGPVQDQVRQVAQRFGWDQGPEWDAIVRIVQKESSWNPGAASPISSARGLFQKMTSLNGPVEPTPAGQAAWGLNYIKGRYGTPTRAWAWHASHNWYDDGGIAYGRGLMLKNTDDPERVLPPAETQAYPTLTRLTQQLEAGRVPTTSLASGAAQARAASLGATTDSGALSEVRLTSGQLRILGPDLVEIVDGRLELVADKLTDGRVGP